MEIIFIPKGTAEDLMNQRLEDIRSNEFESIKNELSAIDKYYSLTEVNLGEGADWVLVLAVISGLTTVFLLGDKIETGLEGWIKIGERIKNIFSKTEKAYVDIDGATLLSVEYLSNNYNTTSLKKVMESTITIKDLSVMLTDRKKEDFKAKPFCVYLMTFEINDHILTTIGVRSDGKITEHYSFNRNDHVPF